MLWWRKIRLVKEPKMDVHPLGPSDAHLFVRKKNEEIVNKVFDLLENPTLFFHKVYAVLGEYGSGKTSIVNYVRYSFFAKNIQCRDINLSWKPNVDTISGASVIRSWFIEEIKKELVSASNVAFLEASAVDRQQIEKIQKDFVNASADETDIRNAFETLCKHFSGFIIFIDELHRLKEYQQVLNFLKSEQWLFQELCKLPITIFVAGSSNQSSNWGKHLSLPEYSGIFDEVVVLPKWDSRNAYELIDKRLRDAAADREHYVNPFAKDALDRVPVTPLTSTPREWIRCAKRILEYIPEETQIINAPLVAKALRFVNDEKIEAIQSLLKKEFPNANRLIQSIQNAYPSRSEDLMTAIAYLYHEPIPDVFVDFDINKVGVEDLSALLSILEGSGITVLGRQSTSPFRVKRQNVELWELSRKVFRLNKNLS